MISHIEKTGVATSNVPVSHNAIHQLSSVWTFSLVYVFPRWWFDNRRCTAEPSVACCIERKSYEERLDRLTAITNGNTERTSYCSRLTSKWLGARGTGSAPNVSTSKDDHIRLCETDEDDWIAVEALTMAVMTRWLETTGRSTTMHKAVSRWPMIMSYVRLVY